MKVYHLLIPFVVISLIWPKAGAWIVVVSLLAVLALAAFGVLMKPLFPAPAEKAKKED
ncbi:MULTISPECIES: hypothetical protein [Pseudomonas]|uniref:Uncharacterized protein n=1 Tax=Pseudomonas nitroreducens TaxID=46680 RepID=A0ABS0KPH7_PSENT|nr:MULTISPECIES: hypothetical protein [Pseudomonas]MBG6289992.1 hypothetical protein [Pseudomonas nitroreducens]MDU4253923.1 hypothetical protein [Pseudomonas sp.]